MPTINKPKKKSTYQKHGRSLIASAIYRTQEWQRLRTWKVCENPLCEDCINPSIINENGEKGECITPTEEVHHITPILTATDELRMKELAYNPTNLVSLCKFHHRERHKYLRDSE